MALGENGSDMVMPVAPINNGWGGYGGFGNGFGGDLSWIVILFLFAMMGGGFGNGFGGNNSLPWLFASNTNTDNLVQGGFNQAATAGTLAGIQSSISNGFANAEIADCNRSTNALQTAYQNEINSLDRSFAAQTAVDSRLDNLDMALQNCCCENRAAVADLKYTVATENCADRAAVSDGIRDVLAATQAQTQAILDKMCQQEIDAKNETIANLRTQVNMQNLAASQAAQTAALVQDNNAQTSTLIQRIAPYPIPAFPVGNPYGYNGYGNGCGYGFGFNNGFGNVGFGNGSF